MLILWKQQLAELTKLAVSGNTVKLDRLYFCYIIVVKFTGGDFWTGGLNPGLLWIWSHSARAVAANNTNTDTVVGEGRCLAWVTDPARNTMVYRGQDCALRHRYICENEEDKTKLGNEISRVARQLRGGRRIPKILWTDE